MKITAQEEYGLRCALQLARAGHGGSLTIPEIASREGLSTAYVGKLLTALRQAGLVASARGRTGGYTLTRATREISVAAVLAAFGSTPWPAGHCERHTGALEVCIHADGCSVRTLWGSLDSLIGQMLGSVSLADLVEGRVGIGARSQSPNLALSQMTSPAQLWPATEERGT